MGPCDWRLRPIVEGTLERGRTPTHRESVFAGLMLRLTDAAILGGGVRFRGGDGPAIRELTVGCELEWPRELW